jgi:tetratricopeptide (TPR) repeat protein
VLPAATQQALLERASGNPLYAEQFARLYLERGAVDDLALPDSVHGLIAARLDGLPAEEKALLQDAAVMGKVFWPGSLGRDEDPRDVLHALERKEFVRRERRSSVAGEEEFAFRHVLVRDVAYGQVPRAERAAKHVRAAAWIESLGRPQDHSELLAGHYLAMLALDRGRTKLTDDVRDRTIRALGDAAERASALNNFDTSAAHARTALTLVDEGTPGRAGLLFQLGRAEASAAGGGREALVEAAVAFEAMGRVELAAESRVLAALGGYLIGREDDLEEQLVLATQLVSAEPPSRAKAIVWSSRARHAYLAGRPEEALEIGREALEMAEALGADEIRAEALLYVGGAKYDMGDRSGIDEVRESLEVAKAINAATQIARTCNNLAILLRLEGQMQESLAVADEGLAVAERFGMEANVRFAHGALPFRLYEQGRWDEGFSLADEFLAQVEPGAGNEGSARIARALIRLGRDDLDGALADSRLALDVARGAMAALVKYPAYNMHAFILAATGAHDEARETAQEFAALRRRSKDRFAFGGDAHVVWTWEQLGMWDELMPLLGTGPRTPWLEAAEAVAEGDWSRATAIYERCGSPLSVAFSRLQTGRDADLRAALDFYRSVSASRYVRQAETALAATA